MELPDIDLLKSLEELILLLQLLSPLRLLLNVLFGASAKAEGRQALEGIDCVGFRHLKTYFKLSNAEMTMKN